MPGWIPPDSTTHFSQDDFLHWLGAELGPCGLDVALPAGSILERKVVKLWLQYVEIEK